jgi:hypothetical protein
VIHQISAGVYAREISNLWRDRAGVAPGTHFVWITQSSVDIGTVLYFVLHAIRGLLERQHMIVQTYMRFMNSFPMKQSVNKK